MITILYSVNSDRHPSFHLPTQIHFFKLFYHSKSQEFIAAVFGRDGSPTSDLLDERGPRRVHGRAAAGDRTRGGASLRR
jgi:hypothetical protein